MEEEEEDKFGDYFRDASSCAKGGNSKSKKKAKAKKEAKKA